MLKRGQVTIFLIVGIVLLGVFSGVFYLVSTINEDRLKGEQETPLYSELRPQFVTFVESCLEQTAEPGLYLLGKQGGIIEPEGKFLATENDIINYAYLNGEYLLHKEEMETQLNRFIEDNLNDCINNFAAFQDLAYEIRTEEPQVKSLIQLNSVDISLNYPLEIISGKEQTKVEDFKISIDLPLGGYLDTVQQISSKSNSTVLDLSFFAGFEPFITLYPFDGDTTIFSMYDEKGYEGKPYAFIFAIRDENVNHPPELEYVSDVVLSVGVPFEEQLEAQDKDKDVLTFYSSSDSFPVSEEGIVNFTSMVKDTFEVIVGVKDNTGLTDEQTIRVVIE